MTWNPKNEPIVEIDLEWVLDNIYPEDVDYYVGEVEGCDVADDSTCRDLWFIVKYGMLTEHRDVLFEVFRRVGEGDFGSPDFNDNPIRVSEEACYDGHHRIVSAWMWGLDKVPGVIE
jgi:hypothetical protein